MYGQTSGTAGQALQGMDKAYPVAMQYLRDADRAGPRRPRAAHLRRTPHPDVGLDARSRRSGRRPLGIGCGRRPRSVRPQRHVQGAAAELFKAWAATVRARLAGDPDLAAARIVLCLHDELLIHAPADVADRVAVLVHRCLDEASGRWFRGAPGRALRRRCLDRRRAGPTPRPDAAGRERPQ